MTGSPNKNGNVDLLVSQVLKGASSKGAIQFPLDKPIPYDLIKEITLFRVRENLEKAKAKKKS